MRIVIIEDDATTRQELAKLLTRYGYDTVQPDQILSKAELLEKLWNDRYYLDENVLLVNMTRLKHKLREIGVTHLLQNVRGEGWIL